MTFHSYESGKLGEAQAFAGRVPLDSPAQVGAITVAEQPVEPPRRDKR